jgi:putative PIG3 family NAD(P)H quinone oxidoreductase
MHAITISKPGEPEVLRWSEAADPEPGPNEVIIDVAASAVNRADALQRQGYYPPPPGASDILGLECSGTVSEIGTAVQAWKVGDEVCALLAGGGYAEKVAVPAVQLLPIPKGIDLIQAAALPEVACTVWSNIVMKAHLSKGEVLLVHGGAGGIGTHAIQVGKALGATVAVTAGTDERLEKCRELGADILINYRDQDFVEIIQQQTQGADVILDNMGASYLDRNIQAMTFNGRLVIIGMQGGVQATVNLGALMAKRGSIISTGLRNRPVEEKAEIVSEVHNKLWPLVENGSVLPIVGKTLPLSQAALAHQAIDGDVFGKIVLVREK